MLNPPANGKIQGLFKALVFFKHFQGKFNFQGLFKTVLYIQVLFKPVQTLVILFSKQITKVLISLCGHAAWSAPLVLVTNPEDRFSRVEA